MISRTLKLVAAMVALAVPVVAHSDCVDPTGEGKEAVCYTGVFPPSPVAVELGAAITVPIHYANQTNRPMTFTIEMVGNVIFPGSRVLHTATLDPQTEQTFPPVVLQTENSFPIGTDHVDIGWSAVGEAPNEEDYMVTVQRRIEVQLLIPTVLKNVIQLPTRWCVVEGSPQAQGKHAGELIAGDNVMQLLQRANDQTWTPAGQIMFRSAVADGIPVICDPDPPPTGLGKLGDLEDRGTGVLGSANRACRMAWNRIAPGQPGRVVVSAGTFQKAGLTLGESPGPGSTFGTAALCTEPRKISVAAENAMEDTVLIDQALYGAAGTPYVDQRGRNPAAILAHELGHQLFLGHGNGLDDNHDGTLPPATGPRRYDEYCDPLCSVGGNCTNVPKEDELTPNVSCEASSSVMYYVGGNCTNLRPLQAETARGVARVAPGAVVNGVANSTDGGLGAFGTDPCGAASGAQLAAESPILDAGMAETAGADTTDFFHHVSAAASLDGQGEYLIFADLDDDPATGCAPANLGYQTTFQGAELVTAVSVAPGPTASARMWRCAGTGFETVTDPRIAPSIESQTSREAVDPARHVVIVSVPNDRRGPAANDVRLQALVQLAGQTPARLPASDAGAGVSRITPTLPTCTLSPIAANPGGPTTVTVAGLTPSSAVEAYLGDERVAKGTTDAAGGAQLDMVVPAASSAGVRPVTIRIPGTARNAVCPLLVQGVQLTPATTASLSPAPNWNGWNNAAVTVSLNAVDAPGGTGIASIEYTATGADPIAPTSHTGDTATVTIDAQGTTDLTYSATNLDGVMEAPRTTIVRLDTTKPTIAFGGNPGPYGILDTINITCTASDALSGVASTTCQSVSGPAYTFPAGVNSVSASATDFADNVGTGSTTFTVKVTFGDLCTLTKRFISTSKPTPSDANLLGKSLCAQLTAAEMAATRGDLKTKTKTIGAYTGQVNANTPLVFTTEQSAILRRLAAAL